MKTVITNGNDPSHPITFTIHHSRFSRIYGNFQPQLFGGRDSCRYVNAGADSRMVTYLAE